VDLRIDFPWEVRKYLQRFPEMIGVIVEAVALVMRYLPRVSMELSVCRDLECGDGHIVLYVRLPSYDRDLMTILRSIRRQYRNLLVGKSGWFVLTTDFRKIADYDRVSYRRHSQS